MADVTDLRERAREHLRLAQEHLASRDEVRLRYAALELRMCIEALAYNLLKLHRSEASLSLMGTWQPDRMLKELAETVRGATGRHDLEINVPEIGSVRITEYRMDGPWVRRRYQKIGSLLHVPMLRQLETGTEPTPAKMRAQCEEIERTLALVLGSEGFDIKIDRLCGWPCSYNGCTYVIEKDYDWFESHKETTCPECGALHVVERGKDYIKYKHKTGDWSCSKCGTHNQTPAHEIKLNARVRCTCCEEEYEIYQLIKLREVKSGQN
jgi:hypothetical protein